MKQARWMVAMVMILAMVMLSGCSDRDGAEDGSAYDHREQGEGGILSHIADDMENGLEHIRNGMDDIGDDVRTDLGEEHHGDDQRNDQ